jgi:hypothetical protein
LAYNQRQIHNALRINQVPDARVLRFHHACICSHYDLFRNAADIQHDIYGRIGRHLKHDTRLQILAETRHGGF